MAFQGFVQSIESYQFTALQVPKITTNYHTPTVVQLKRRKGVVVQDCDVYIGRRMTMGGWNLPQSDWANPFKGATACPEYEAWIRTQPQLLARLSELSGKRLGCWCVDKPQPCHGQVLVKLFQELVLQQPDCSPINLELPIIPDSRSFSVQPALPGFPELDAPPSPFLGQYVFPVQCDQNLCTDCQALQNAQILICDPERDLHVICFPQFITHSQANDLWTTIINDVPLRTYQGQRQDIVYDYPRKIAVMSDSTKIGKDMVAYGDRSDWHPQIYELRQRLQQMVGNAMSVNSVLINYYQDPKHKISAHADRETTPPRHVVIGLTLAPYYPRRLIFKEKKSHATGPQGKPRKWSFYPPHGSLYIMNGQVNKILTHESPALTKTEITKFGYDVRFMQRMSLTFR